MSEAPPTSGGSVPDLRALEHSCRDDPPTAAELQSLVDNSKDGLPLRRPMNAFLIFCKKHRSLVREKNPHLDNRSVTRILGELWANLPFAEKDTYLNLAKQYRDAFMKANPDFHWHGNKRENQAAFKPANKPWIYMAGNAASNSKVKVIPGKLADPSNMGGLGLLLMAGGANTVTGGANFVTGGANSVTGGANSVTGSANSGPGVKTTVQPNVMSPPAAAANKNTDNVALLQLAEMCSSQLESTINNNTKSDTAVNQLGGSYAMTPPWTPQYESDMSASHDPSVSANHDSSMSASYTVSHVPTGHVDPSAPNSHVPTGHVDPSAPTSHYPKMSISHNPTASASHNSLSPSEPSKDWPLDLSKPSTEGYIMKPSSQTNTSYKTVNYSKPLVKHAEKTEPMEVTPIHEPTRGFISQAGSQGSYSSMHHHHYPFTFTQQLQGPIPHATESRNTRPPDVGHTSKVQSSTHPTEKDKTPLIQSVTGQLETGQTMNRSRLDQGPVPLMGSSRLDQGSLPPMGGRRDEGAVPSGRMIVDKMIETVFSKEMNEDKIEPRKRSISVTEGRLLSPNCDGHVEPLTFGEIQETLIRKAMEDSNAFNTLNTSHKINDSKVSHMAMDLAVRNFNPNNRAIAPAQFVPVMLPSNVPSKPDSSVSKKTSDQRLMCDNSKVGKDRSGNSDNKRLCDVVNNKLHDKPIDLVCREDISSLIKTESSPEQNKPQDIKPDKTFDAVDLICREELSGYDSEETKNDRLLGLNAPIRGTLIKNPPISGSITKLKDSIENQLTSHLMANVGILPKESQNKGHVKLKKETNYHGNFKKEDTKGKLKPKSFISKKEGKSNKREQKYKTDSSDGKEKKPRRRRRNVMEMTIDPYGEKIDAPQGEDTVVKVEDKVGSGENEEDDTGVRKSKRRNRGQKYQELLSQGLLQAGRNKRTESNSESCDTDSMQHIVRKQRKSLTCDGENTSLTSFDLDAEIACLPACHIEGTQRPQVVNKSTGRGRHRLKSESGKVTDVNSRSHGETQEESNKVQGKEMNIAELCQLTKVKDNISNKQTVSGSQKRKARKMTITHLVAMEKGSSDKKTEDKGISSTSPSAIPPLGVTTSQSSQNTTQASFAVNFATLVDVAVAENEKLRNLTEVTVSCT